MTEVDDFWNYDCVVTNQTHYTFNEEDDVSKNDSISDEIKRRNRLCRDLLDVIKDSVMTFKPSKSLASLKLLDVEPAAPAVEIDVVVSGGGLKGYFMTGCSHILKNELQKQNIKIARIAGASAGAWCGLFMMTNLDTLNWLETYYLCKERPDMTMHEAYVDIWPWLNSQLPADAWKICSGRLFISITEVTMFGFRNRIVSEYTSNRDLFEACLASSTVPYISLPHMLREYRNMWCIDGGVTNNTPIFDDNVRRQLVFRLCDVFYPVKFLINPHDHCIESLVVRGAILMSKFLQGEPSDSFAWLNPSRSHIKNVNDNNNDNKKQEANEIIRKQSMNSYLFASLSLRKIALGLFVFGAGGIYVFGYVDWRHQVKQAQNLLELLL